MSTIDKITGTLVFVSVQKAVKAYVKPGAPAKPDEWKASVVVTDEDFVDEFEEYARSLDTQVSIKKVNTSEFESIYKCSPPEDAGKKVWVITLRKSTELGKTGKAVPEMFRPRVLELKGNVLEDITYTKLVGNGSKGTISIDRFDRSAGGSSLYLKNVLVTDLVEYVEEEKEYAAPGSEFADVVGGVAKAVSPVKAEKATEAKPAKGKAVKKAEDAENEEDPF